MFWSLKPALRFSSGRAAFSNVQFAEEAEKTSLLGDSRYDEAQDAPTAAESVADFTAWLTRSVAQRGPGEREHSKVLFQQAGTKTEDV